MAKPFIEGLGPKKVEKENFHLESKYRKAVARRREIVVGVSSEGSLGRKEAK